MRDLIQIVENADIQPFVILAQKHDTVEAFLQATDGEDVLYRGHHDDETPNHAFMTDYIGHAGQYAGEEGRIDAYAYNPHEDVILFNDNRFDEMRFVYMRFETDELAAEYQTALAGNRHAGEFEQALQSVYEIMQGEEPYSEICGDPSRNDTLVPLMSHYAWTRKGKNIIAFHGSDYAAYGGQIEFVVRDVSLLVDLRALYSKSRAA